MEWIYISPHLDDVALSLGGLVWEQSNAGEYVSIWTICAGDPPPGKLSTFVESLHDRWETGSNPIEKRRSEDIESCKRLGAQYFHFNIPDCIYRRSPKTGDFLYDSEEALWMPVHPDEHTLIEEISQKLETLLPTNISLICPMAIGNHVDHHLTRRAVEEAIETAVQKRTLNLYYYADYPYIIESGLQISNDIIKSNQYTISEEGMQAWQDAIACHQSQISTFWRNLDEMRAAIQVYYHQWLGVHLWKYQNIRS